MSLHFIRGFLEPWDPQRSAPGCWECLKWNIIFYSQLTILWRHVNKNVAPWKDLFPGFESPVSSEKYKSFEGISKSNPIPLDSMIFFNFFTSMIYFYLFCSFISFRTFLGFQALNCGVSPRLARTDLPKYFVNHSLIHNKHRLGKPQFFFIGRDIKAFPLFPFDLNDRRFFS